MLFAVSLGPVVSILLALALGIGGLVAVVNACRFHLRGKK